MNASKKPVLLIAVAVLVLGLMGWTLSKQFVTDSQSSAPSATAQPPAAVDGAVGPSGQGAMPAAGQGRIVSPDDPGSLFAKPVDPAQQQKENDRALAEFERQHRAEPVDAAWAGKAEPTLAKILTNDGIVVSGLAPEDYRADCRSQTCRVSATFKTHGDAEDWGSMYITLTGDTFQQTKSMVIPKPDGTAELRIYGYRRR